MVRRLEALRRGPPHRQIAVAEVGGRHHPLCAVYALATLPEIDALLAADRRRPFFLFERVPTFAADAEVLLADEALRAEDPELRSLENVNTPEEYAAALESVGVPPERQ